MPTDDERREVAANIRMGAQLPEMREKVMSE